MRNFNKSYLDGITNRLDSRIKKFTARREAIVEGRVIPDEDDLDIGKGRSLDLAVLFLDICSFSSWPQGMASSQTTILSIFNVFMSEMMCIAEDYSGEVEKNTGDGLMAYFGGAGTVATEEACKSAVGAAITMLYVAKNLLNPALSRDGLREVEFRIGIDYGPVTIAVVGGKRRFKSRVAIGSTAINANRMLDEGTANQVVVGQMVVDNLPSDWRRFCKLLKAETGWTIGTPKQHYSYYLYDGRWLYPNG